MTEADVKPQEPSIEEILSSIRKIISDDDVPSEEAKMADTNDDVLQLTDVVSDEAPASAPTQAVETPHHEEAAPIASVQQSDPLPVYNEPSTNADEGTIISSNATAAAVNAFAKLSRPPQKEVNSSIPIGTNTLEDIVREMLRPMLREWMDKNLPSMVERMVERELRKIGRNAETY